MDIIYGEWSNRTKDTFVLTHYTYTEIATNISTKDLEKLQQDIDNQ